MYDERGNYRAERRISRRPGDRYRRGGSQEGGRVGFPQIVFWAVLLLYGLLTLRTWGRIEALSGSVEQILQRLLTLEENNGSQSPAYQSEPTSEAFSADVLTKGGKQEQLAKIERPRERTEQEVLERLSFLGLEDERIRLVQENSAAYPRQLLEALANNPEMADFASQFLEKKGTVAQSSLTESEKQSQYPLFLQWDSRWGYAPYGDDSVVGLSGCGPTALAMALYYLTGNDSLTPDRLAAYSMENGYYVSGTGTSWLLMEQAPLWYGLWVSQPDISREGMERALDRGDIILCSMGPGDFTIGGHFVVIYGYDEEGFLINDPNSVSRSRIHWSYEKLEPQMKHIWVVSSKGEAQDKQGYEIIVRYVRVQ